MSRERAKKLADDVCRQIEASRLEIGFGDPDSAAMEREFDRLARLDRKLAFLRWVERRGAR